jgi:hypothetical protein
LLAKSKLRDRQLPHVNLNLDNEIFRSGVSTSDKSSIELDTTGEAMSSETYVLAEQASKYITSLLPETLPRPQIGIICGSGLSELVSTLHADPQISIPYVDIPNFPVSTVSGHQSRLVFGTLGKRKIGIAAMVGRLHSYEGHDMSQITLPIRVFHLLGIKTLIGLIRLVLNIEP